MDRAEIKRLIRALKKYGGERQDGETCKTCHKKFDSGIWVSPQFYNEKVLLFCSDKCKEGYFKKKLERIKVSYPNFYEKLVKSLKK